MPENTFAAFDMAIQLGGDVLELDVKITKDGHLVVYHYANLNRTTEEPIAQVQELTLSQIRQLDAAWNFSMIHKSSSGADEKIFPERGKGHTVRAVQIINSLISILRNADPYTPRVLGSLRKSSSSSSLQHRTQR